MKKYLPPKEIIFFILLYIIGVVFFEFFRLVFLLKNFNLASSIPSRILVKSFLVGWRFDTVITCYIIAPFFIIGNLQVFGLFNSKLFRNILFGILILLFGVAYFLCLVDIEFFKEFNSRLNFYAAGWFDTPRFILKMLWEMYPVVQYSILFILITIGFVLAVKYIFKKTDDFQYKPGIIQRITYFFVFAFLIFVGIRGRLQHKSPIRWGNAYFSTYNFANQMALNPIFTLGNAIIENKKSQKETGTFSYFPDVSNACTQTRKLLKINLGNNSGQSLTRKITFNEKNRIKYNVVLILIESFASSFIGVQGAEIDLTPNFNKLSENSILFTNFFSDGTHTYNGLFSSLTGLPNPPGQSILKRTIGQQEFPGLGSILRDNGYETCFFCPHDPVFDNMAGFLKNNGFNRISGEADYDKKFVLSTLGVSDHIMFEKVAGELSKITDKPFFAFILTATNHGPWILPNVDFGKVNANSAEDAQRFNAFKYSDWALNRFIELSRKQNYFRNTIFVITGDHGRLHNPKYDLDISEVHIPLLIYAPSIIGDRPRKIHAYGGQVDILPTIMGILKLDYSDRTLGRDLLKLNGTEGFAQFREGALNGFINYKFYLIDRLKASASLYEYGSSNPTQDLSLSKKEDLQKLQTDLRAYLQTGEYIINKRYKNENTSHN